MQFILVQHDIHVLEPLQILLLIFVRGHQLEVVDLTSIQSECVEEFNDFELKHLC